jgi:hypothetical protein
MNCLIADRTLANLVKPESTSKKIKNLKDYLSDLPVLSPDRGPETPKVN